MIAVNLTDMERRNKKRERKSESPFLSLALRYAELFEMLRKE